VNIKTLEVAGLLPALKGMRNPKNSWHKSDIIESKTSPTGYFIGPNDKELAVRLVKAGPEHCKFLRQIQVWVDMDMPRYWWCEFDTYKFNTKNSCSTMHKLMSREIKLEDFQYDTIDIAYFEYTIDKLNRCRKGYNNVKSMGGDPKGLNYWRTRAKRILPESYLQLRTVNISYAELMNVYHQRKNHKMQDEWIKTFCKWCETLPYFKEFCIEPFEKKEKK